MDMEHLSDPPPVLDTEHEIKPGSAINQYQIRGKLLALSAEDKRYLSDVYSIPAEEVDDAVLNGAFLLATDAVTLRPTTDYQEEETQRSLPPRAGAHKLSIGAH